MWRGYILWKTRNCGSSNSVVGSAPGRAGSSPSTATATTPSSSFRTPTKRRRSAIPAPTPGTSSSTARPCARISSTRHQAPRRGALVLCGPHLLLGRPPPRHLPRPGPRQAHQPAPQRPEAWYPVQQPQRHVRDSHRSLCFPSGPPSTGAPAADASSARNQTIPVMDRVAQRDLVGRLSGLRENASRAALNPASWPTS